MSEDTATLISTTEGSAYLRQAHGVPFAASTLTKMRCVGGGPKFVKVGKRVFYQKTDLDAWIAKIKSAPIENTSHAA